MSSNGGNKFDDGKLRIDLIPPEAIEALASVLGYGADKYDDRNWEEGMNWSRVYASSQRHLLEWYKGVDTDEESGFPHLHHVLTNVAFLLTYADRGIGKDDRVILERKK